MPASSILRNAVALAMPPGPPIALAGAAPPGPALPPFMQTQVHDHWCWTAVATSVGLLLATGPWTQCDTATRCLPGKDCCLAPDPCNVDGALDQALTVTKSLAGGEQSGAADPATFEPEIAAGHPVCVRVAWFAGNAHFLAITGYADPGTTNDQIALDLQDPLYGPSTILLGEFPVQYRTGGDWTHFYLTAPQP